MDASGGIGATSTVGGGARGLPVPLRIVIAGGGTGGHLFPGIAIAREILSRQSVARVSFAGTAHGIEARVVPREGFELDLIRSGGLKGKSLTDRLKSGSLLPLSVLDAWRLLSVRKPHLVLGVGGYSSGPVVLVASLRGVPTMLLEQNAVPGLTNRMLAPFVRAAAVTYESTRPYFGSKTLVSGNPVRAEFLGADERGGKAVEPAGRTGDIARDSFRVLVFGGSQGAHAINLAMAEGASDLAAARPAIQLTHQTGERDVEMVRAAYRQAGLPAVVEPFLYDMGAQVSQADLIVCRAGATTLAEITAAGKPALLVPLPTATDDHQRRNAEALVREGAADMLLQTDMTGHSLVARIQALAADGSRRGRMALAARALARPDAARVIVDRALALIGEA